MLEYYTLVKAMIEKLNIEGVPSGARARAFLLAMGISLAACEDRVESSTFTRSIVDASQSTASASSVSSAPVHIPSEDGRVRYLDEGFREWKSYRLFSEELFRFRGEYNHAIFEHYLRLRSLETGLEKEKAWHLASSSPFFDDSAPLERAGELDRPFVEPWKQMTDELFENLKGECVAGYSRGNVYDRGQIRDFEEVGGALRSQIALVVLDAGIPGMYLRGLSGEEPNRDSLRSVRSSFSHKVEYFRNQLKLLAKFEGVPGRRIRDFDANIGYYEYELGILHYPRTKPYRKMYEILGDFFEGLRGGQKLDLLHNRGVTPAQRRGLIQKNGATTRD